MSESAILRPSPPLLYDPAPEFTARTTMGERRLSDYRGRWLLLFSHPADFTPVCTSEFLAFAHAAGRFRDRGCELLALSVNSLFSHLAWLRSIRDHFGVIIPFPIVEDPSMAIAGAYGMIAPNAPDTVLVRAAFVIDPGGVIRAISWYPMTTGRSVAELLRVVTALQMSDAHDVATPEGWEPGGAVILPPLLTAEGIYAVPPAARADALDWCFRLAAPPGATSQGVPGE